MKNIADVCKSLLRNSDIFGRYGGEEFVVVCPETDLVGTLILAERLRVVVEEMKVSEVENLPTITISLGVAGIMSTDTDITKTINRADKALYQAKREGRNKVVSFQES